MTLDETSGTSSKPETSEDVGSQPTAEDTGSKAESTTAPADSPASMGDAIKAEMARINTASQERVDGHRPKEAEAKEESPPSKESGKSADSDVDDAQNRAGEGEEREQADGKAEKEWLERQKPETAKRFQELTGKLKSANETVERLNEQVDSGKQALDRMDAFNRWVNEEAGFKSQQQWQEFLQMGHLINNDPAAALERIDQYREQLASSLGLAGALPDDIQQRLDDGLIDEASARELAKARRVRDLQDSTRQEQSQRQRARDQARAQNERLRSISEAVNGAESAWRAKDPDYDKLAPDVQDKVIALLQREGRDIKTKEDAVALYERAVEAVKNIAKLGQQQRREIRQPGTGAGSGQRTVTESQPKTLLGAMKKAYSEAQNSD